MANPIYDHMESHASFPSSPEKKKCIQETVDELMNPPRNLDEILWDDEIVYNPEDDCLSANNDGISKGYGTGNNVTHSSSSRNPKKLLDRPGLLLGKVQCGKTDTFEKIIGLAFDKGIDIAIILTKGTNALVNQTISRLQNDFSDFCVGNPYQLPVIEIKDIIQNQNGFDSMRGQIMRGRTKLIIVSKKEDDNLGHLIRIFSTSKDNWLASLKVLIVDDEADFASRGYQRSIDKENAKLAIVSGLIDKLRMIPSFCPYLQVTATPYSLFLQPDGFIKVEDGFALPFRPRFTKLVPIHDKYVGGEQYFVESKDADSPFSHLFYPVSEKCVSVMEKKDARYLKNGIASSNIIGLTKALLSYLMASAIRIIQEKALGNDSYRSSAVFHANVGKKEHKWQKELMEYMLSQLKQYFLNPNSGDKRLDFMVEEIYKDLSKSIDKANNRGKKNLNGSYTTTNLSIPSLTDIKKEIADIFNFDDIVLYEVNSDNNVSAMLDNKTGQLKLDALLNIFIGGNILDRGITINNLLCFFYGRNPGELKQDTVLQHARYYGSRTLEDMAVTRLHTTEDLYDALEKINNLDDQLRDWFAKGLDKTSSIKFIGFDQNIKPTNPTKILPSKTLGIKPHKIFLPKGMWTGSYSATKGIMDQLDQTITGYNGYVYNQVFEMDVKDAQDLLVKILSTYKYDSKPANPNSQSLMPNNYNQRLDMYELMAALHYCTNGSNGKIQAVHITNRNLNRIRENGGWIDSPADGKKDLPYAKTHAVNTPVLMLIRENGDEEIVQIGVDNNGNPITMNKGWNNASFYWPVLVVQQNVQQVLFTSGSKNQTKREKNNLDQLMAGYNPEEILKVNVDTSFLESLIQASTPFSAPCDTNTIEIGVVKSSAHNYFERDNSGNYVAAPNASLNPNQSAVAYSYNNGIFPFVLKPYKYLLLSAGQNYGALVKLLPATQWTQTPEKNIQGGWLCDYFTDKPLIVADDTLIAPDRSTKDITSADICQWILTYPIEKVERTLP